jgi:hypothetical protein
MRLSDQPHLTRSLKKFIGHTDAELPLPAQLVRLSDPARRSVQGSDLWPEYNGHVLTEIR